MKLRTVLLLLLLVAAAAFRANAQSQTAVSATVDDPNGIPYNGARVTAQLQPAGVATPCVTTGGNCVPISGTAGPATLNASGAFTMNVYPNGSILCGGQVCTTTWLFTVVMSPGVPPPLGTGPQSFSVNETISGSSQNISSDMNAAAVALIVPLSVSGTVSWSQITSGTNANGGNFITTEGNWNFSAVTNFELPTQTGFSASTLGQIGFDLSASNWHVYNGAADSILATFLSSPWVAGDAVTVANTSGKLSISDFGHPAVGYTGSVTATHLATWSSAGVLEDGGALPSAAVAIQSTSRTTLSSNISLSASTPTTVVSKQVTMPSSGCPCRVIAQYTIYLATNNWTGSSWVTDGTNVFASGQTTGVGTNTTAISAEETSQTTYANSATPTFTLTFEDNGSGGTINAAPSQGSGSNTFLTLTVMTSN